MADRPISDDDLSAPEEEPGQAEPHAADDGEAAEHDPAPEDGGDSEDQPPS